MREIGNIHIFEDRAFLAFMTRVSGAVLIAGICGAVMLFGVLPAVLPAWFGGLSAAARVAATLSGASGWLDAVLSCLGWCVVLAVCTTLALTVHELVHGLFFKALAPAGSHVSFGANWGMGMLYACAEGIVYSRGAYLVIILAPTVAVSALVALAGLASGWYACTYIVFALHLSGCVGDWGYARAILRDRRISYCEDTDWGVRFLGEDGDAGGEGPLVCDDRAAAAPGAAAAPSVANEEDEAR